MLTSHDDNAGETPVNRINRLLQELIELTGPQTSASSVLELQIGDIFTRSAIAPEMPERCLAITALLPKCEQPHYLPRLFSPPGAEKWPACAEFLWHADEGCYIVVHKVPVVELTDERSIMDSILLTADIARDYFAALSGDDKPLS
jgi:hypothetical protein